MDRIYVMQLVRSFQVGEISRRTFLKRASVAVGGMAAANMLLAACQPVTGTPRPVTAATPTGEGVGSAATNLTTDAGLQTGMVQYPGPNGSTMPAYVARPAGSDKLPGVIVIQEWWGLDEHIKDVTRRFAKEGYVAIAPDLYKGVVATEPDEARKLVMQLDMPAAVAEIHSAADYLLSRPDVTGPKVGIVGFCMGGGLTLMTTVADEGKDKIGAAIAFYGMPLTAEQAAGVKVPILGNYAGEDQGNPVSAINTMKDALTKAGVANDFKVYPGAQHAFFNNTRSSYNAEAAKDSWQRTLAWLKQYVPGQS